MKAPAFHTAGHRVIDDFQPWMPGLKMELPLTLFCHDLPQFADRYSSARESSVFSKVKRRFFRYLRLRFAAICRSLPTVVKLPGFYYVLTTIRCRNLPHFAPFCHFSRFSWQNVSDGNALNIVANRGIRRQIGALERRFSD